MLGALALIALLVVDGWRDARQLPWAAWRAESARRPAVLLAAWAIVALIYHLATAPWLIGLCWLAAALLAFVRPRWGVYGALALLPFYFQHKEITFPNRVLTVPPTHALVVALLPALVVRGWLLRGEAWKAKAPVRWYDLLALAWLGVGLLSALGVWNWQAYRRGMVDMVVVPLLLYAAVRLFGGKSGSLLEASERVGESAPKSARLQIDSVAGESAPKSARLQMVSEPHESIPKPAQTWVDASFPRNAMIALFVGGLLVALLGLWRWLGGRGTDVDGVLRLVGTQFSPNHTALYLLRTLFVGIGVTMSVALGVAGGVARWQRWVWLAATAVVGVALLLTASRGAILLGLPVGLIVALWLWLIADESNRGQRLRGLLHRPLVRILLLLTPVLLLAALFVGESRLLNAASVDSRFLLWRVALDLWRAHPLVGVGVNGFFWTYPAFLPAGAPLEHDLLHPHNIWLELLTGWGVLGLVWLLALLGVWLTHAALHIDRFERTLRWCAIGLAAALAASVAHGQVDAFLALPDLAGWHFAAMGIWASILVTDDYLSTQTPTSP